MAKKRVHELAKQYDMPMPEVVKRLQAYGIEYSGAQPITSPLGPSATSVAGMEQPVYFWDPVIAPSGKGQTIGPKSVSFMTQSSERFKLGGVERGNLV